MGGQGAHRRNAAAQTRTRLLQGVSAVAFVTALAASPASAQTVSGLRGAAGIAQAAIAAAHPAAPSGATNYPGMSSAQVRALQYQARAAQGVDLATQAQQAARASALALSGNVPNGLGLGGLDPVDHPLKAEDDPTGLSTWDGAGAPTQTRNADGTVDVTIDQTQQRAVLSWDTFNVGEKTTLTFNQKQDGVAQPSWVVLNRVVGQLDPATGLRRPDLAPAPSQILGSIKADGTVLILNQNGVLFGGASQVNVHSLVATSLEIGRAFDLTANRALTIKDRNDEYLDFGLLAFADQASSTDKPQAFTFSAQQIDSATLDPMLEGTIQVDAGAEIKSADQGFILLTGPKVTNAGHLVSPDGEVALASGRQVSLTRSEGRSDSADPNVRGFLVTTRALDSLVGDYVLNTGLIEVPRGYVSLGSTTNGAVLQNGVLHATTSVSRNGFVRLEGGDIQLGVGSTISIEADDGKETIPQDPTSLDAFKSSRVEIGDQASRIRIGRNSMIYAPGADISIGAEPGATTDATALPGGSRVFVDTGAIIDAAGLTDILIPASRNSILIRPVKKNELRDTPDYRDGFLNGAEVYVDPRISGVRSDGVTWIGSPLVEAESYYQQVGVSAAELMTRGGNVTLGTRSEIAGQAGQVPSVIVKAGAVIDVSGGWVKYQAGMVQTSRLINANGQVVDIADADPNDTYIGIYGGFTDVHSRWGVSETWANPLMSGAHYEGGYTEGRDAGTLTIKASSAALDGTVYANAYAGARQLHDAQIGTGKGVTFGDLRHTQAAPSQMPIGGMLFIQALGKDANGNLTGGGDIQIVDESSYHPLDGALPYGQTVTIDADGNLVVPPPVDLAMPAGRLATITLSDQALSGMGLGQLSLHTSGEVTDEAGTDLTLSPGGVFDALAGRTITIDGAVTAASGDIRLQTANVGLGSVFNPGDPKLGSFDIVVNGTLSTRGQWVNDFGKTADEIQGSAYTDGGRISIISAARVARYDQNASLDGTQNGDAPTVNIDLSGSILINQGATLDVSGGGRVRADGGLDLSARGGDLSLINDTTYFQIGSDTTQAGGISGFRVGGIDNQGNQVISINPGQINAKVEIDGTILAHGFNGGGTFTLDTPEFSLGGDGPGTSLALDFFSQTGFGAYDITSYKTALLRNEFKNGLEGYNAVMQFQTLTIGAGQTLDLTQSGFSQVLDDSQTMALRSLGSGGDLYSVMKPTIAPEAWDRRAVNLTFGGALELHVDQGGAIVGQAGGQLTVSKLLNEGLIHIPGGTIRQSEVLPSIYDGVKALGVHDLSQVFSFKDAGGIRPDQASTLDPSLTNEQVAASTRIYLTGDLGAFEGVRLAEGSVTDLSGEAIINPRATAVVNGKLVPVRDGRLIDGGALITMPGQVTQTKLFTTDVGVSPYNSLGATVNRLSQTFDANPGSFIDLSGASDTFAQRVAGGYAPTQVWSDGGSLMLGSGGAIIGADIDAHGGAQQALGGTLVMLDPHLSQSNPDHDMNAVSADLIESAGFSTFEAMGSINGFGEVKLHLDRAFFLVSRPVVDIAALGTQQGRDALAPVISSTGVLEIDAPYIRFDSAVQGFSTPFVGDNHKNTAIFRGDTIDISGAVLFDQSIDDAQLIAAHDLRLTGVQPYQHIFETGDQTVANSLQGMLSVSGDLAITAGQVYPTTGSSFTITSAASNGRVTFSRASDETPDAPYSAGGALTVQAAEIVQGGVIRAPLGKLTLGSGDPLNVNLGGGAVAFAPGTKTVELLDGSLTSVSAEGLSIPYGTTTDQIEWFFSPTSSAKLTAPPTGELHVGGDRVSLDSGADVDLSGGGDVFAYEFISGTGGSRDVLDRFNADPFSSHTGFQYPDGRQVYAIVPGLSDATIAPFDPIYSSDYSDLYGPSAAGQRVYLSGGPGLPAGWYTLLPAKYAVLPGGMRVVEQVGAPAVALGQSGRQNDGSLLVSGYYGVAGTDTRDATVRTFQVQDQATFRRYSTIALTYGNATFAALAAKNGEAAPRLPIDAARLVLAPTKSLTIDASFDTAPAQGGRGAQADIAGDAFQIVSSMSQSGLDKNAITLTADSLTNLNAQSLLIGGVRTDNADGTTSLDITAQSITVANDADHPLTGPELVLAVDGQGSSVDIQDGAVITATGTLSDPRAGAYLIDGSASDMTGIGAVVRISSGPERLVERTNAEAVTTAAGLNLGAATLDGDSVLLSSSGDLTASDEAEIRAKRLALGAGKVSFTDDGTGLSGLVITPTLQALFGKADHLTIQTPQAIDFKGGTYSFGDLTLDTGGFGSIDGGAVTLKADDLTLANSAADLGACGSETTAACGSGALSITATEIAFQSGQLRTYGFGGAVTLTASKGVFAQGKGGFDAGPAALAIQAPFIGDRAVTLLPGEEAILPSLSFTTTAALTVTNPGGADAGDVEGAPGASISLTGDAVSITGATIRATAGKLEVTSNQGLVVGAGAVLETPGYSKTFGDSADPYTLSAPGGLLHLTSLTGGIDLQAGSTVSVGGGKGRAGTLAFTATQGEVNFGGTLDTAAPDAGGSFVLDIGGGFDLDAFESGLAANFTGTIDIHTRTGDLTLSDGHELTAENLYLSADAGLVDIGGTIDVSGVNGGDVSLFGMDGVRLESTAFIDAHAEGYADADTRQAHGGVVLLGTDGDGAVNVLSGARIGVSAKWTGERLVPMTRNGTTYYTYVPGDAGGVVGFRLPILGDSTSATVNLTYAGQITGASSIVLEVFKHFDLGQIADDPGFVGVTINSDGQAVLDLGATGTGGQLNWLADSGAGALVDFVQGFGLSDSMSGQLGGLQGSGVFHARPGMELDYGGDIVLSSNWNLGAGALNLDQAWTDQQAAGAEQLIGKIAATGQYYILPGKEQEVFNRYGSLTYRTGGLIDGEPGVLTLRAGGNLDIKGSITDGFFQFHDQNDPNYLKVVLGSGNPVYLPSLNTFCLTGECNTVTAWQPGDLAGNYVSINFPGATGLSAALFNPIPYNAAANTPAAPGSLTDGAGDPLASAELFPLLATAEGAVRGHVESWSYRLVGGADLIAADPMRTLASSSGSVIVEGTHDYSFKATAGDTGASSFNGDNLFLRFGGSSYTAAQWEAAFLAGNPSLTADSYTFINFEGAPAAVQTLLAAKVRDFLASHPDQAQLIGPDGAPTGMTTTVALAAEFMADLLSGGGSQQIVDNYTAPKPVLDKNPITGFTTTLVRTGSGSIEMAAAADIDLRNGADPTYRDANGNLVAAGSGLQVGGAAVYTAGYRADLTPRVVTDELTHITRTIDSSAYAVTADNLNGLAFAGYRYGADFDPASSGYSSIYLANPVYAEGGGDVSLTAGRDVLSRRDIWNEARVGRLQLSTYSKYIWMGAAEQLWRTGAIGAVTNVRINPQLFREGVGALGGGDIAVHAGRDVVDLSVVADTSLTTADVLGGARETQALWSLGRGDISLTAGRDLLGGRVDIGSGSGDIDVGGSVLSAGQVVADIGTGRTTDNQLLVRLSDATVAVEAMGSIDIQGVRSLGVIGPSSTSFFNANLNGLGFYSTYSGLSLIADGGVTVQNSNGVLRDNLGGDLLPVAQIATNFSVSAVYPASLQAVSFTGDLDLVNAATTSERNIASSLILTPSPVGELRLLAGADIAPLTIAMEDGDPGLLPGLFSNFTVDSTGNLIRGRGWAFPGVLPSTLETDRRSLHNQDPTHQGDEEPNRIFAGNDILDMIISTPKQTRIGAGRDIVNMMFFGQNLTDDDITRIVAGRDITATTHLVRPVIGLPDERGAPLPALDGNTFVIGGPGAFFLEAGRDAGPFLNSAVTSGFTEDQSGRVPTGLQSYAGGIISVGNEWNPWLQEKGADLYVMFGVGKGANYDGLRDYYVDPANLDNLDGDLFAQVKDANGELVPDRSRPIYGPILIKWMQDHAAAQLQAAYGRTEVSFQEAYDVFKTLPALRQRIFLLDDVYFNELIQTSRPDGPSFQQYSRGYLAVNTLFPASLGYTQNDLSGGGNGANQLVHTGDLDLRLAAIETSRGGNIYILGPGGRVLAGSTVRTSEQAARRVYDGGRLFTGNGTVSPLAAAISSIPLGFEGVLTLRGGSIYTFTDQDFLLNQSRLFTEAGGDIAMWSSNGDLNAGQGPKTSASFPPVAVKLDEDAFSTLDTASSVSGAGIAAFQPAPGVEAPDVFLIAPRGTVDAGDAGVRVAGNLFIAALQVANANNFAVGGTAVGIPTGAAVDVGAQTNAGATAAAAAQAAESATTANRGAEDQESVISANVVGYAGGDEDDECKRTDGKRPARCPAN